LRCERAESEPCHPRRSVFGCEPCHLRSGFRYFQPKDRLSCGDYIERSDDGPPRKISVPRKQHRDTKPTPSDPRNGAVTLVFTRANRLALRRQQMVPELLAIGAVPALTYLALRENARRRLRRIAAEQPRVIVEGATRLDLPEAAAVAVPSFARLIAVVPDALP